MILQLSIIFALLAQQISSCPYAGKREMTSEEQELHRKLTNAMTPAHCLTRPSALIPNKAGICRAYNGMKADFLANMPSTNLGKSNLFGAAVRLAFHDAGEANMADPQDLMGPDGCLSSDTENNGLTEDTSIVNTVIEASWQDYCDDISRADFWVLFAKIAMEYAEPTGHLQLPFQYGRVDATSCEAGNGRIPDASGGLPGVISFIFDNMGLNLVDLAALLGAHSLGHVHLANSGFAFPEGDDSNTDGLVNAWDTTPHVFDNLYYKQLLTHNWHNVQNPAHTKGQWKRNPATNFFVMLNVDMALAYDLNLGSSGQGTLNQVCGPFGTQDQHFGCYPSSTLMPPTCNEACRYANSNEVWLNAFLDSWGKMTTVGYGLPDYTEGSTSSGKLGTLYTVDLSTC